jgi:glucose-1-phosphate thymidylyltransferase
VNGEVFLKGIILAGGRGTRLGSLTQAVSKQLLPVFDKPMIFYPITTLMLAGVNDFLVITTPQDENLFRRLLANHKDWGVGFEFAVQAAPRGIAEALIIGEDFSRGNPVAVMLGDNILHGSNLAGFLNRISSGHGATIFAYPMDRPESYGVIELDAQGKALSIEEKPSNPRSNYAIPGLYFFDGRAADFARLLLPSERGELEITDLIRIYLEKESLNVVPLDPEVTWLDMGTAPQLLEASNFVKHIQDSSGLSVGAPWDVAMQLGISPKSS